MKRLMIFCFVLFTVTLCVLSCPYHDRLKALQAAQRERTARLTRLNIRRNGPKTLNIGQSVGHHSLSSVPTRGRSPSSLSSVSVGNSPSRHSNSRPSQTRYTGYNSNRGYFVQNNVSPQRHVYIGDVNSVYRPSQYVKCPNSRYHVCPLNTECLYEFGAYRCRRRSFSITTCREGLKRVNISSVQYQCIDINECEDPTVNNCDQVCRNTHGSFKCDCNPGFTIQSDGSCQDVDECTRRLHRCQHECVNSIGSYECVCPNGYVLMNNTLRCKDVDECLQDNICLEDEACLNTYGSYECNMPPPCGPGYHHSKLTGTESGPCIRDDYTRQSNLPISISYNRFALHSNYPSYSDVGKLHFTNEPGHRYSFRIVQGSTYFSIVQRPYWNYIIVRTRRRLSGPVVYEAKILVTDYDRNRSIETISRVDLAFVVSAYNF